MVICAVINCSNRSVRDTHVSFYSFPRIIENKGKKIRDVSDSRRKEWISRINRADMTNLHHKKVCSEHFISGKPSDLMDQTNPDWAPSLKLGHTKYKVDPEKSNSRYKRACRRNIENRQVINSTSENPVSNSDDPVPSTSTSQNFVLEQENPISNDDDPIPSTSTEVEMVNEEYDEQNEENKKNECILTDMTMHYIEQLESEIRNLRHEKDDLKNKLTKATIARETATDEEVQFYTGLPNNKILHIVFNFLVPKVVYKPICITMFKSFFLFMMKLRLNLLIQDIAYRFSISPSTVVRIFYAWLDAAYICFSPSIYWPEREALRETMPLDFRMVFGMNVAVTIDCFEIRIDRPTSLIARANTWSNYKHNNTIKVLLGIAPQGVITFISRGWGGRVSDKYITENSGILENLQPGDYVLADRGFNIGDSVGFYCAQLIKPASARGKKQLSPKEIQDTRKLASLRIHVERVIGNLRQKYRILKGQLPVEYLAIKEGDTHAPIDKILKICSAFTNLSASVVALS